MREDEEICMSTHGRVGWASGSFVRGDVVVCGLCGREVPIVAGMRLPAPPAPPTLGVSVEDASRIRDKMA